MLLGPRLFASATRRTPKLYSSEELIDEEKLSGYNVKDWPHAHPGDVLNTRYRLISKTGWGSSSTVWLSEIIDGSLSPALRKHVAVKLCKRHKSDEDQWAEANMNKHLTLKTESGTGGTALATCFDAFQVFSPEGHTHTALVFDVLREPLWKFRRRITNRLSSFDPCDLPLLKRYVRNLLEGLNYMHTQRNVIHTNITLDSIMVTVENDALIETYARKQGIKSMPRKQSGGRTVYRSHNDLGPARRDLHNIVPVLADFGEAQCYSKASVLRKHIQPDSYRAPEVLLGLQWSYSADIWNFGLVVWDLLTARPLFNQPIKPHVAARHLAEIIGLLGDIPDTVCCRVRAIRHQRQGLGTANCSTDSKVGATGEATTGKLLDDEGKFLSRGLIPRHEVLDMNMLPPFLREDGARYLTFMRRMLCWDPEERATAADLMTDPWLQTPSSARSHDRRLTQPVVR